MSEDDQEDQVDPVLEAEKMQVKQALQIPCDICGEVLCDGFCDKSTTTEE